MTDTDVTFLFCYNIIGHAHMYVMTFTSTPFLPLSRPWAGFECAVADAAAPPDLRTTSPLILFLFSQCLLDACKKIDS